MDNQDAQKVRCVHGALLKNERLKLYRKPSTWVLMGIIIGFILLGILLTRVSSTMIVNRIKSTDWKEDYANTLQKYTVQLKNNPDNPNLMSGAESLKYLIDNQISPSDWRTDAVTEYYNLKYGLSTRNESNANQKYKGYTENGSTNKTVPFTAENTLDSAVAEQKMNQLKTVIDGNDWRSYIRQRLDDLENGAIVSANDDEKEVDVEICNLYLDNDITPISISSPFYQSTDRNATWKSTQVQTIRQDKLYLLQGENAQGSLLTYTQRKNYQKEIAVAQMRLSTNTKPVESNSFLGLLETSSTSLGLLSIMLVVIASNSIATEFGTGTIKLLLISPHKRQKIFWAKAALLIEISFIALAATFILSFLISGALAGFTGIGDAQVLSAFGKIIRIPYLVYILFRYLLLILPVLAYGALALMMSAVTRKNAVSIAVTLILMFGSDIIMSILLSFSNRMVIPGIKFLLFANTTLAGYLPSASSAVETGLSQTVDGTMTLGFSVGILLIYITCFLWIARDSFCRRDVK